jgi:hypothetical protein
VVVVVVCLLVLAMLVEMGTIDLSALWGWVSANTFRLWETASAFARALAVR